MKLAKLFAILLCLAASAHTSFAQATLSIQGTIQKSTGATVDDGDYKLTFKLYTTETGGTEVWSEVQDPVSIIGGVYSVTLGTVTPLTAAFDQTYYLGITVGTSAELTPRAQLTSSPYSIALLGQSNQIPSTGAVKVGNSTVAEGKVVVEGSSNSEIQFKKGGNTASITFDGTNIQIPNLASTPATDLALPGKLAVGQSSVDGNNALKVNGTSFLYGFVQIDGATQEINGTTTAVHGNSSSLYTGNGAAHFIVNANGRVRAHEFWAHSDRRIKKDFHLSENLADLATLRKLRVTDYRHIDAMNKGNALKKGFVAQEVEASFPEAVTITADFIPNVYALSTQTKLAAGKMTISLEKNHEFAVGDEVKLMLQKGDVKYATVVAVADEKTFIVDWTGEAAAENVFVYGKKVADFHSVDYDRIFTLNVSATQELAREVEDLKKENAALRQQFEASQMKNEGLQKQNSELRSDLNGMNQRLLNLEKRATAGNLEK